MFIRYWLVLTFLGGVPALANEVLMIDDRRSGNLGASLATTWRLVTDSVMGGVSSGTLTPASIDNRECLRMQGDVRLENNGGFVQAALDLDEKVTAELSAYSGIVIEVYGNDEAYNLHLRTSNLWLPWQSYRATFQSRAAWQAVQLPFTEFSAYRTSKPLEVTKLERIGVVAIGRAFTADLCIGRLWFYK